MRDLNFLCERGRGRQEPDRALNPLKHVLRNEASPCSWGPWLPTTSTFFLPWLLNRPFSQSWRSGTPRSETPPWKLPPWFCGESGEDVDIGEVLAILPSSLKALSCTVGRVWRCAWEGRYIDPPMDASEHVT